MKHLFFLCALCILTAFSCSKKTGTDDNEAPVVSIIAPTLNQVFTGAQSIYIAGSASDNKYIEEIHIEVTDFTTGSEYLHVHIHPDGKVFSYNQAFTVQPGKHYKIRVLVEDASSNSSAAIGEITCN